MRHFIMSRWMRRSGSEFVAANTGREGSRRDEKKSREMPRKEFEKAKQRLKAVRERLTEEKKHEKRS
jgi:hypothetical protein